MRVLVTGATGLIGKRLILRLIDRDDTVQILTREPLRALPLKKLGVRVIGGDITQARTLPHALQGVDTVYHVAALVGPGMLRPPYTLTNVTGTRQLLDAAVQANVRRFVHVSSIAAYAHPQASTSEDAQVTPHGNAYSRSKALGDLLVQSAMRDGKIEAAIVRPAFVYDTGTRTSDLRTWIKRAERLPLIPFPGGGAQPCEVVHADDVAQLLVLAGNAPNAAGQAYNASGDEDLCWNDLFTHPPRFVPLPGQMGGGRFPAARARAELGYAPAHRWHGHTTAQTTDYSDSSPSA